MTDLLKLYQLADQDGIMVDSFDLEKREALSMRDSGGDCYIAINPFLLSSVADEKTKLAHELGHCETGSFYNAYSSLDVRQKHENRADKWAIKRLVPEGAFQEALKEGDTEIWNLAERFGVTEDFMKKAVCYYTHGNLAVEEYL